VDKAKIKFGVVRIAQSSFSFFAQTFLRLVFVILIFAGIIFGVGYLANQPWDKAIHFFAAGLSALVSSISVTQWLLLILVLFVWNISVVGRRILHKLTDIEAALSRGGSSGGRDIT
jgi:hypothetical protein